MKGTFWQITDIHWDHQYSTDGDRAKMCHKNYNPTIASHIGVYGDYLCDSPWPLVRSAIQAMVEIKSNPDFVLWTGDNVPHTNDPEPDYSVIFATIANITTELKTAFPDTIPILPVLGNHDAYPKDDYPVAKAEFYGQYLTKGGWSLVLPKDAQEEFKQGGYYGYDLPSGVTVLVVNTNLYYAFNQLGVGIADPCGQFAWLRSKLQQAKNKDSKVIVTAHAPPGYFERFAVVPFFNASYNTAYVNLLTEFGEVIMAQIYGHEHTDTFRLFSGPSARQQSVGFLAPSITPWQAAAKFGGTAINPSLRLYLYNKRTLLDYNQYHLNLTKLDYTVLKRELVKDSGAKYFIDSSNVTEETVPTWELYYQASKVYNVTALDYNNMAKLYEKLKADNSLFQKYYLMNSAGYNHGPCDPWCKMNQLCAIANIHVADLMHCMTQSDVHDSIKEGPYKNINFQGKSSFHLYPNGSSNFLIALVALSMILMVVLAITLAIMLVLLVVRKKQPLQAQRILPITDLTLNHRGKKYSQLV
ncbi:hypothetical protein Pcinc_026034 [Petrolisthes cinctipes]|uniref:Acid sphingomyelinase-like phosphodiesterase n=1 Tax=Petrolisthes cinctipes TaxID=88211 RepID=A0AAE1KAP7_PETCI|nr:hypothetical protein Pcinc_026034 [Petrolisthes cinctipes]